MCPVDLEFDSSEGFQLDGLYFDEWLRGVDLEFKLDDAFAQRLEKGYCLPVALRGEKAMLLFIVVSRDPIVFQKWSSQNIVGSVGSVDNVLENDGSIHVGLQAARRSPSG